MKKLTDQELDSVFKNAAEGYEPAFDPADWDAMNAKLDQPRSPLWKRWMPFALLGLVIFSTGVLVGIYLNEKPLLTKGPSKPQKEKVIEEKNINTLGNQKQSTEVTKQTAAQKEGESEIIKRPEVADGNTFSGIITAGDQEIKNNKSVIIADNSDLDDDTKFISQEDMISYKIENLLLMSPADSIMQEVGEVKGDTSQSDSDNKKKKGSISLPPIFLRALVSPDFSSISYASATSIGSNYALLVEYQITDRWSISSGGILSMKEYATDEEFTYGKYTADRMRGDCRVLDIPLNAYYRFLPHARASFYAGLGFSSYFMLEEKYTYTFDLPTGSRDFTGYIEKENIEWFKMLNISLGVQYRITKRIHMQLEPFLKVPLAGIGEWDVKLSSMGVFMGLKYKIN